MTQNAGERVTREDYLRAERFLPHNVLPLLFDAEVTPHWIDGGDRFWYRARRPGGTEFALVDPEYDHVGPVFDHVRLAAALSAAAGTAYEHTALPFETIELTDGGAAVCFEVDGVRWRCDLETYACAREDEASGKPAEDELPSPDKSWLLRARGHNLFVRPAEGGEERQLTFEGARWYAYGVRPSSRTGLLADVIFGRTVPPVALWSPDSKRIVTHRLDERQVGEMHLVQTILPEGAHRPIHHAYRTALVGDEHIPRAELVIVDLESGHITPVRYPSQPATFRSPIEWKRVWWSGDSARLYLLEEERHQRTARFVAINAATGEAQVCLVETGETFVETVPVPYVDSPPVRILEGTNELIWYSTRDGWGHLYRYDLASGELKNQITHGPWVVRELVRADEDDGWVFFLAGGREEGRDPYLRHLYRVRPDGTELALLTPEDADHQVAFSPSGRYFVDVHSRVDLVPSAVLRSADGRLVRRLEAGDASRLVEMGWRFPERFSVKARDGVTDLCGVIVRPTAFDPSRKYPVLDSIYPGPQIIRTPKRFTSASGGSWLWQEQALAELGFIVVTIDGPGTPFRSKAFLNRAYGKDFGVAGGLEDHVAGIRQLAARDHSFDLARVGIYGHSGGGYASTRALLMFPEFYKVAVSSAGSHDVREYVHEWGERYVGPLDEELYWEASNYRLAANLRGKLLLAYGELDDNVPPALTLRLIDALVAANKDYDLLVLPHVDHAWRDFRIGRNAYEAPNGDWHPYFVRRRWDYFVRHLLGAEPPANFEIRLHQVQPLWEGNSHDR